MQVAKLNNHDCIAKLLPLFDDDTEHDEAMFSIINVIERFDDNTYVHSILNEIVSFYNQSPRWARILHMRILNSPATLAAYAN
ncbi:MAG: Imm30 family immunity protein, partial [Planctomycetaceae bacterium]